MFWTGKTQHIHQLSCCQEWWTWTVEGSDNQTTRISQPCTLKVDLANELTTNKIQEKPLSVATPLRHLFFGFLLDLKNTIKDFFKMHQRPANFKGVPSWKATHNGLQLVTPELHFLGKPKRSSTCEFVASKQPLIRKAYFELQLPRQRMKYHIQQGFYPPKFNLPSIFVVVRTCFLRHLSSEFRRHIGAFCWRYVS